MKKCEGEIKSNTQTTDYNILLFLFHLRRQTARTVVNMKCIVSVMKFYQIAKVSLVTSYLRLTISQRGQYIMATQSGNFVKRKTLQTLSGFEPLIPLTRSEHFATVLNSHYLLL